MPRSIGLEVTETAVRVVDLEGSARKLRLLRYAEREIPVEADRPWAERAARTVAGLFAELKLPRDRVVASLDSGDVLFRFLALPFKNDDQIRKVVKFELESQLQNYAADDLVVDYIAAEQSEKGTLLLTAAAPKKVVRDRLDLLQKAGIDPAALDLDVNALFNAFARATDLKSDEPFVLVHGGTRHAKLLFVQRRIPRFVRTLRFALAPALAGVGAATDGGAPAVSPDAPTVLDGGPEPVVMITKSDAALPAVGAGIPALPASARDRIALLGREVSRFLLSSLSPVPPTCLLLTGEFAHRSEVGARLEEETQLPTDGVDFLAGIESDFAGGTPPAHLAIPLGLALKGLDIDRTRFDFRKEEFVFQRRFEVLRLGLAASVVLTAILLFLPAIHFWLQRAEYQAQLDRVLSHHQQVFAQVFPELKDKVDREKILLTLRTKHDELRAEMGDAQTPVPVSAVDHMRSVFEAARGFLVQQAGGGGAPGFFIAMDRFTCNLSPQVQWHIEFVGQITNPTLAEGFQNALKAVPAFEAVTLEGVTLMPDGKYRYTMRVRIKKPSE